MNKKVIVSLLVALLCGSLLVGTTTATAVYGVRTLPNTVAPSETFQVSISAANMGTMGFSREYLPTGFTFVNTSVEGGVADIEPNGKGFPMISSPNSFTYNVTAPADEGFYAFNGTIQDVDMNTNVTSGDKIIFVFSVPEATVSTVMATRTLPSSVTPGETFQVSIDAANMGTMGFSREYLPPGFTFVNTSVEGGVADVGHNGKGFPMIGSPNSFTYNVTAPLIEGVYPFNGTIQDADMNKNITGGSKSIIVTSGVAAPTITTYTLSNTTITPPQETSIDVEFSETVGYIIAIENSTGTTVYDWTGTAKTPQTKTWAGTYESDGTPVPDGIYTVNVTGTNASTGLSVTDISKTITVTSAVLPLTVTASPSTVYVGAAIGVIFNVTDSNGAAVGGATVTLTGNATGSGTTDASGLTTISVNATGTGAITATATMTGYTENTTTITASAVPSDHRAVVLVYNSNNTGYNFIAWSNSTATTASDLCTLIRDDVGTTVFPDNAFICRWDTTSGWVCHTVAMGTGQNFEIQQYEPVFVRVWVHSGTFCMPIPA